LLKRRSKRRYIAVRCDKFGSENGYRVYNSGFASSLTRRVAELYGYIVAQKSSIRDIGNNGSSIYIIRCNLKFLSNVLSAIPLMNPPALVLLISGTIRSLRINLQKSPYLFLGKEFRMRIENQYSEYNLI